MKIYESGKRAENYIKSFIVFLVIRNSKNTIFEIKYYVLHSQYKTILQSEMKDKQIRKTDIFCELLDEVAERFEVWSTMHLIWNIWTITNLNISSKNLDM